MQFIRGDIPFIVQLASSNVIIALTQGLWRFLDNFFFPLFLMYLATSFIWVIGATGLYVRRLADHLPLRIQLTHPDNCGGFKFLGIFALNMALVTLADASLLALYTLWSGYTIWSVGTSTLLLFLIIASYGTFFAPIFAVHRSMLKERSAYEDAIAGRTAKIEEQINEALRKGDLSQLKTAKEDLELAHALFPDTIGFPNWPFNWRMLITFFSSQLIPIISFAIGASPVVSDFFAKVLSLLSRH